MKNWCHSKFASCTLQSSPDKGKLKWSTRWCCSFGKWIRVLLLDILCILLFRCEDITWERRKKSCVRKLLANLRYRIPGNETTVLELVLLLYVPMFYSCNRGSDDGHLFSCEIEFLLVCGEVLHLQHAYRSFVWQNLTSDESGMIQSPVPYYYQST